MYTRLPTYSVLLFVLRHLIRLLDALSLRTPVRRGPPVLRLTDRVIAAGREARGAPVCAAHLRPTATAVIAWRIIAGLFFAASHPVDPGHPPASLFVQTSASTSTAVHPTSALGQQAILFGGPGAGQGAPPGGGLLAADPLRQALLASNPAFAAAFSGLPTSVAGNYPFLSPAGYPPSFPGLLPPSFLHGQSPLGVPTSTVSAHGTQLPTAASGLVRPAGSQSLAQTAEPPAAASVKVRLCLVSFHPDFFCSILYSSALIRHPPCCRNAENGALRT